MSSGYGSSNCQPFSVALWTVVVNAVCGFFVNVIPVFTVSNGEEMYVVRSSDHPEAWTTKSNCFPFTVTPLSVSTTLSTFSSTNLHTSVFS